jgi:hypothetical protein
MSGLSRETDVSAAAILAGAGTTLETGRVTAVEPTIRVALPMGEVEAKRARGCLVEPEVGDVVLCAMLGASPASDAAAVFVLSVLEGSAGASVKLAAEGDLEIASRAGRVAVKSAVGVEIAGGEVALLGRKGTVAMGELGILGRALRVEVTRAALVAEEVESLCARVLTRARQVLRFVETRDVTRAGSVEVKAQRSLVLRGERCVVAARAVAKVDGEQVHLG